MFFEELIDTHECDRPVRPPVAGGQSRTAVASASGKGQLARHDLAGDLVAANQGSVEEGGRVAGRRADASGKGSAGHRCRGDERLRAWLASPITSDREEPTDGRTTKIEHRLPRRVNSAGGLGGLADAVMAGLLAHVGSSAGPEPLSASDSSTEAPQA